MYSGGIQAIQSLPTMAPARVLERNIRPSRQTREEEEDDGEDEDVEKSLGDDDSDEETESEESRDADGEGDEDVDEQMEGQMSNVSFGVLRKAQEVLLSKKRKRGQDSTTTADAHEEKLQALRARLRQIKDDTAKTVSTPSTQEPRRGSSSRPTDVEGDREEDDDNHSDSDSAPSEEGASTSRTSKHAPMSQTTRHQVTRKRTVISVPKRVVRDPRFDALSQRHTHPGDTDKAYSFLRDYQESEIKDLAAAIRASKSEDEKESLRRTMMSMQNRLRAKDHQKRAQEVLKSHRKEEKEKVLQGKTPFYLKKKELKERTLVEKYKGMKGREREKAMDKKRKKEGQREKRRMPEARRGV